MVWDELKQQVRVQRVLANQVSRGRIGHAYLFTGTPGTKMNAAALTFAQALNCESSNRPCGVCSSCRAILKGIHPDVKVVRPDGATLKLGQIRSITAEAVVTPNLGPYRVYIIEDAHSLTREASNALLLTLEEPPSFVVFILMATAPVSATVESRCQVIKFNRVVDQQLLEQKQASEALAVQVVSNALQATQSDRVKYAEQLDKDGIDLPGLLDGLLRIYRDLWVLQLTAEDSLVASKGVKNQLGQLADRDVIYFASIVQRVLEAQRMLSHNVNRRLLLETVLSAL